MNADKQRPRVAGWKRHGVSSFATYAGHLTLIQFSSVFIRVHPCSTATVRLSTAMILRLKRMCSFDTDKHGWTRINNAPQSPEHNGRWRCAVPPAIVHSHRTSRISKFFRGGEGGGHWARRSSGLRRSHCTRLSGTLRRSPWDRFSTPVHAGDAVVDRRLSFPDLISKSSRLSGIDRLSRPHRRPTSARRSPPARPSSPACGTSSCRRSR